MINEGKVIEHNKSIWKVYFDGEVYNSIINNSFMGSELPSVGDNVLFSYEKNDSNAVIKNLLPRKSVVGRVVNGEYKVIATNVDVTFIVTSMNKEFNIGKLERFYLLAKSAGTKICFVLNKSDLVNDKEEFVKRLQERFANDACIDYSIFNENDSDKLFDYWNSGETAIFLGSSGVGKSSIINSLYDKSVANTGEIRRDDKGRHTTTGSHVYFLSDDRVIIDSPGVRSVGISNIQEDQLDELFSIIAEAKKHCKYNTCSHTSEEGCYVLKLIEEGVIPKKEYERYLKLERQRINEERKNNIDKRKPFEKQKDLNKKKKDSSSFRYNRRLQRNGY